MSSALRPYQQRGLAEALEAAREPRARRLWCAPTGTGKGTLQIELMAALRAAGRRAAITTPSGEIARGMLDRMGLARAEEELTEAELWRRAERAGIYSPMRLRNRLAAGRVDAPDTLLVDEAHHVTAASTAVWERLVAAAGDAPILGWTATPYRGSHSETEALREWWGEPRELLSIRDAAAGGWLAIPEPATLPLLDDATVRVVRGDYDQEEAAEVAQAADVWGRLAAHAANGLGWLASGRWTRPTLIAVPTAGSRAACVAALVAAGAPAAEIAGETPRGERDRLLAACRAGELALAQIQVLAEGVDMPWMRRLIDCRPLRSPVAWMQLLGRITRPLAEGEAAPEYICCCRNLERHSYLLRGEWPARHARAAAAAFGGGQPAGGGPLDRGVERDALKGRRRALLTLLGGGHAEVVHLGLGWDREALVVGVPGEERARVYERRHGEAEGGGRAWGRWRRAELPADGLRGWGRATKAERLSERQLAWYERQAAEVGLDAASPPARDAFPAFAALCNSRETLAVAPETAPEAVLAPEGPAPVDPAAVAALAEGVAALDAAGPAVWPATWARLRDSGDWGARLEPRNGARPEPGDVARLRSRDGREAERTISRVVASGEGWALAELGAERPETAAAPGRYAVEDAAGTLRFIVVTQRHRLYEQAGGDLHRVVGPRVADLARRIEADPEEAARRYGRELGICGRCGRELTDAESRARGLGSVCSGKD